MKYLTLAQTTKLMNVSRSTIWRLSARAGFPKGFFISGKGRRTFFVARAVKKWKKENGWK